MRHPALVLLVVLAAGCRDHPGDAPLAPPVTPAALKVPAGQKPVLAALGAGDQIYTCAPAEQGVFAWKLEAPDAKLYDAQGKVIGKHYAGPTWESIDGSKVVGHVEQKADAPEPGAIPWLLLAARSNEGSGVLSAVKSVQRVDTSGGQAPKDGCDAAHAGAKSKVGYRAKYYFYAP
jgi:hypothetical protein